MFVADSMMPSLFGPWGASDASDGVVDMQAAAAPLLRRRKGTKQDGGRAAEDTSKETEAGSAGGKNVKETKVGGTDPEKSGLEESMDVDAISLRTGARAGQP
jgi:hypothetical protein